MGDEFVCKYPPAAENAVIAGDNQIVANRTKERNKLVALTVGSTLTAPSSSDNDDNDKITKQRARNTTNEPTQKRQKKTVKVLRSYIQFKGASIKRNGKPLLKAGLIE